jgi:hypothetical protein
MYPKTRGPRAIPEDEAFRYDVLVEIACMINGEQWGRRTESHSQDAASQEEPPANEQACESEQEHKETQEPACQSAAITTRGNGQSMLTSTWADWTHICSSDLAA